MGLLILVVFFTSTFSS